jgi:hypothetical protein
MFDRTIHPSDHVYPGYPSTVVAEINAWQSLVATAYHREHLRGAVRSKLSLIEDSARTLQNIALGRGVPSDLLNLRDFVEASLAIRDEFRSCMSREGVSWDGDTPLPESASDWAYLRRLLHDLHDHGALASDIRAAIEESVRRPTEFRQPETTEPAKRPPYVRKDKWVMKSECVTRTPCHTESDFENVVTIKNWLRRIMISSKLTRMPTPYKPRWPTTMVCAALSTSFIPS